MKILLISIKGYQGENLPFFGGKKSCSHIKHNQSKQKLFFQR